METDDPGDATLLALVDQAPIGILKVRLDGTVTRANDTIARLIGVEHGEELVGADLRKYLADTEPYEVHLPRELATLRKYEAELS